MKPNHYQAASEKGMNHLCKTPASFAVYLQSLQIGKPEGASIRGESIATTAS
jgi:hypothetical protein